MGIALLAFLGFPHEAPDGSGAASNRPAIDVMAHLTGFIVGAIIGALTARWQRRPGELVQGILGWVAIVVMTLAWCLALAAAR